MISGYCLLTIQQTVTRLRDCLSDDLITIYKVYKKQQYQQHLPLFVVPQTKTKTLLFESKPFPSSGEAVLVNLADITHVKPLSKSLYFAINK